MPNVFVRLLIAGLCLALLWVAIPAFIELLGLGVNASLMVLVRVAIAAVAIAFVIWGKPVPPIA